METKKNRVCVVSLILGWILAIALHANAALQIFVDQNAQGPTHDGLSRETAFLTIQPGLNAVESGGTVTVYPGTYTERIDFSGATNYTKAITLTSDPLDQDAVNNTLIDGQGSGTVPLIIIDSAAGPSTIQGFTIQNGKGSHCGGIQITGGAQVIVENCVFNNNQGTTNAGAMYISFDTNVIVRNCDFNYNIGFFGSGGINVLGNVVIEQCKFTGNSCNQNGGGISVGAGGAGARITNCIFDSNWVTGGNGGAINCHYTAPLIENCVFKNNTASRWGGAVSVYYGAEPVIVNSLFYGNKAQRYGGAIGFYNDSYANTPTPEVFNCTIYGNEATSYGGGIAIWYVSGTVTATNNIINGNSPDEIYVMNNPSRLSQGYNFYDDPYFAVTPPVEDWHFQLHWGSGCVDAGTNDPFIPPRVPPLPEFDLAGNPRINNEIVDIGAFEYYLE